MENSQKLELLDLSAAVTVMSGILERFTTQQLLTNSEAQVLTYAQHVLETRRKELLEAFGIVEDEMPADREGVAGEPMTDSKGKAEPAWP